MTGRHASARTTGVSHLDDARVLFLFRSERQLDHHHTDVPRQKELLRRAFAGLHDDVDGWLAGLAGTSAFYFDSISQIRMDSWSRGRVTLVGDAGYGPGPAVGGSTSLAVVGASVLAGELARAGGDPERATGTLLRPADPPEGRSPPVACTAGPPPHPPTVDRRGPRRARPTGS